jgi:hypothetical protein
VENAVQSHVALEDFLLGYFPTAKGSRSTREHRAGKVPLPEGRKTGSRAILADVPRLYN